MMILRIPHHLRVVRNCAMHWHIIGGASVRCLTHAADFRERRRRGRGLEGIRCISTPSPSESEDNNMNMRRNSILAALALTLIGTAPAWAQGAMKALDPDNDGTVDLAEAKGAA